MATSPPTCLLGAITNSDSDGWVWERNWPASTCSYMAQHRLGQLPLVPSSAYLWIVYRAFVSQMTECVSIGTMPVQLGQPTMIDGPRPLVRTVMLSCESDKMSVTISTERVDIRNWLQHFSAHAVVHVVEVHNNNKALAIAKFDLHTIDHKLPHAAWVGAIEVTQNKQIHLSGTVTHLIKPCNFKLHSLQCLDYNGLLAGRATQHMYAVAWNAQVAPVAAENPSMCNCMLWDMGFGCVPPHANTG